MSTLDDWEDQNFTSQPQDPNLNANREEHYFTSHETLKTLKYFAEGTVLSHYRKQYQLPPVVTWEELQRQDVPIVIPIMPGTFPRPQDWPSRTTLTDFIFLRGKGGKVDERAYLHPHNQCNPNPHLRQIASHLSWVGLSKMPGTLKTLNSPTALFPHSFESLTRTLLPKGCGPETNYDDIFKHARGPSQGIGRLILTLPLKPNGRHQGLAMCREDDHRE